MAKLGCEHRHVAFVLKVLIYIQLNDGQGEAGDVQIALDASPSHRRQIRIERRREDTEHKF